MANINVSNLTEFLTACANATADDKIICPENAEWDWESLGRTSETEISVNADIDGNGTKIYNFFGRIQSIQQSCTITALHILNAVHYANGVFAVGIKFTLCKISCQLGDGHKSFGDFVGLYRCSINVDYQNADAPYISTVTYGTTGYSIEYCRIKISAPNATENAIGHEGLVNRYGLGIKSSELILNCPQATELGIYMESNCTVRGDLQCIETANGYGNKCVIDTKSMTELDMSGWAADKAKWFVTDAQMHDITYLHNIGFEIGSDV